MSRIVPSSSRIDCDTLQFWVLVAVVVIFMAAFMWGMSKQYGCPSCGHVAHPTDAYCAQCGKQLRIKE